MKFAARTTGAIRGREGTATRHEIVNDTPAVRVGDILLADIDRQLDHPLEAAVPELRPPGDVRGTLR
ncbi:hypothetical protein [Rhodococcus sp. USK13]|uniref:hypothetical protein n=1 Tax=Rhodococcus sp. USK13 TaxID=2806442 RepID=UPI001BCAC4E2|nr:hypothetical protein [Rhodococcus sp. USK13]